MTPKKSKEFFKDVAEELDVDTTVVKKVVDHYWNKVYKAIVNIEHSDITVANLGTFSLKKKQLNKKILGYTNYLQNKENLTFAKYHSYKTVEKQLQQMLDAKKIIDETDENKKAFYINKKNNK